ncbi:MAG: hypothetical protein EBQ48_02395 [Betaproteobacteria bacterium]|nr:hypothetical protein [Betaproteobacteria bacterium]
MQRNPYRAVFIAVIGLSTLSVQATEIPKSGNFDYTACWTQTSATVVFSKTHSATTYELVGITKSNIPDHFLDNNAFRCLGHSTNFHGKQTNANVCESIDPSGDKRLSQFILGGDGITQRVQVAGTGKYDGATFETKVSGNMTGPVIKPGVTNACNRQTGTYTLK